MAKAYGAHDPAEEGYPRRHTYVIGADGTLERVIDKVNAKTHPKELLDTL